MQGQQKATGDALRLSLEKKVWWNRARWQIVAACVRR